MTDPSRTTLHLFDGDRWTTCETLIAARSACSEAIDRARDACDPEWPSWVEEIRVYAAPADSEAPDEDGLELMATAPVDKRPAPDGSSLDYICDYRLVEAGSRDDAAPPPAPAEIPLTFVNTNWRGETAVRHALPRRFWTGHTEWHPETGWLMTAFDLDKKADRDFALADCAFGVPDDSQWLTRAPSWYQHSVTEWRADDLVIRLRPDMGVFDQGLYVLEGEDGSHMTLDSAQRAGHARRERQVRQALAAWAERLLLAATGGKAPTDDRDAAIDAWRVLREDLPDDPQMAALRTILAADRLHDAVSPRPMTEVMGCPEGETGSDAIPRGSEAWRREAEVLVLALMADDRSRFGNDAIYPLLCRLRRGLPGGG